ncbi:uncharacterized protein TRIREDRAFT_109960 [Trichoderma reesei QM6a]|uniref:Predicted protein n=1 Tax=Hypocrea jecorina (strain QM6a) TaxID=431241 RepID=G0RQV2_HYPJQ|nr:uncharacterized protein TRIREDRAFT_109960 [Trichoderma reesei QM6a]EGR46326.1 predicted protein [Trichoderma reesei QM6a]
MALRITHLLKSQAKSRTNPLVVFHSPSLSTSSSPPQPPTTSTSSPTTSTKQPPTNSTTPKDTKKPKKPKKPKPTKPTPPKTPLDIFFSSFKNFKYKPSRDPSASWKQLASSQGWPPKKPKKDAPGRDAWDRYQMALAKEVELWFGHENDPKAWRTLCRAVGHADAPEDIDKCAFILRNTHVNIVDLIHWARRGGEEAESNTAPEVFKSVRELKDYTFRKHRVFEQEQLMEYNGGNVVLRHLMRRLFSR